MWCGLKRGRSNIEGAGAVTARDLVINTLRMRPDRIIVGESRGAEALDMLQAMNTGHDGSMTTVHANAPRDAFSRLETMVMMASQNVPDKVIRQQLASAINLVVQCARLSDGIAQSHRHRGGGGGGRTIRWRCRIFSSSSAPGISPRGKVVGRFRGVRQCFRIVWTGCGVTGFTCRNRSSAKWWKWQDK